MSELDEIATRARENWRRLCSEVARMDDVAESERGDLLRMWGERAPEIIRELVSSLLLSQVVVPLVPLSLGYPVDERSQLLAPIADLVVRTAESTMQEAIQVAEGR